MARNTAVGDWRTVAIAGYKHGTPEMAQILVEQADMLDKKLNQRYIGGTYRVRLKNIPGKRTKTFYGEMAWCRARNYASDAASAMGALWWPDL